SCRRAGAPSRSPDRPSSPLGVVRARGRRPTTDDMSEQGGEGRAGREGRDGSADAGGADTGDGLASVPDEELPEDLRPSADNPLAEPADDDVPDDVITDT